MKPATMPCIAVQRAVALVLCALLACACLPVSPDRALASSTGNSTGTSASAVQVADIAPDASLNAATTASNDADPSIKTVRVGWLSNNVGYQNGEPGEYLSGWGYEYLQTLSYYTPGWHYEYVAGTFTELMQMLEDGEIDLMPNISYTEERAEKLLYSTNPQGAERYYVCAKPTNDALAAGNPAALNGLTIGAIPDAMQTTVSQQWIASQGIECTYRYYDTSNELFDALSAGSVDAIIMNDTLSSDDAMPMFYTGETNYYLVTPKARQDLMDDINAAMTSIRSANPRYNDEVKTRYSVGNAGSSMLTGTESAWLAERGNTITVGYLDHVLPFTTQTTDSQLDGSLSALVSTLEEQFGITVATKAYESNDSLTKALEDGDVDVIMPVAKEYWLAEQEGFTQSSTMVTASLVAVYAGGNLEDALSSIAYHPRSLLNAANTQVRYPQANLTQFPSAAACVEAVKSGKASCMILPVTGLDTLREQADLTGLLTAELTQDIELTCWMRQGNPELLSIVNKGIVSASDTITSGLYAHYSYADEESDLVKFVSKHQTAIVAIGFLLMFVIIGVLAWALQRARAAQRQAQSASAAKTAFLARMSHDIRTPLNGIIGLMEVSDLHPSDVQLAQKNRAKAKTAADHLLSLINDILEMSKIEDRVIELEHKPFNLTELCRDVFVLGQIRAADRGVTITTSGESTFIYPNVLGSPTHVRRVFLNLVENCIKYNKPGGTVHCSAMLLDVKGNVVTYRFVVSDTGIGMTPEFLEHIFEPFTQAHDDARSSYQGTGMGMPIVKGLVEKMGGTINVASSLGEGSTFAVELPFTIDRNPQAHSQQAAASSECSIAGMSIMLAEDNELNTEIAQALLTNERAQVTCVSDGQQAVDLFCAKAPGSFDAILMDIMMPKMNGYDAARAIRRCDRPDAATVPIIAMTANAFAEDVKAAKEAGMNAHLSKPIEVDKLKQTLAKYREQ